MILARSRPESRLRSLTDGDVDAYAPLVHSRRGHVRADSNGSSDGSPAGAPASCGSPHSGRQKLRPRRSLSAPSDSAVRDSASGGGAGAILAAAVAATSASAAKAQPLASLDGEESDGEGPRDGAGAPGQRRPAFEDDD